MGDNSIKNNSQEFPFLVEQFHPIKNGSDTVETITIKSAKKVWWLCDKGHEWQARPFHRTAKGDGTCPICSGKRIVKENSLGGLHPELIPIYSKKNKKTVFEIAPLSSQNVVWECSEGHEYKARPSVKVKAKDKFYCPECAGIETNIKCEHCGEIFPNKIGFMTHLKIAHGIASEEHRDVRCKVDGCENIVSGKGRITCEEHSGQTRNSSKVEIEFYDFIKSVDDTATSRQKGYIYPYEIDVFIKNKMIGFEFNGLYWHSEAKKDDRNYHLNKTNLALKNKIRIVHIFENEWKEKRNICESMIRCSLGKIENKINARECKVLKIEASKARKFLDDNHIKGYLPSSDNYALVKNDEILSVLTIKKSRSYNGFLEITRFATKLDTIVRGGFQKILKVVKMEYSSTFSGLVSYCHISHGTGNVYEKAGFKMIKTTKPDYNYTDGKVMYDRFKFRAQPGKTEKEVAEENGVYRIYGCGSKLYKLEF